VSIQTITCLVECVFNSVISSNKYRIIFYLELWVNYRIKTVVLNKLVIRFEYKSLLIQKCCSSKSFLPKIMFIRGKCWQSYFLKKFDENKLTFEIHLFVAKYSSDKISLAIILNHEFSYFFMRKLAVLCLSYSK
jgi:hypothetical protein